MSAPYKKPSVINVYGDGFSQEIDVVTLAIQMGVVKKWMNGIRLMAKS